MVKKLYANMKEKKHAEYLRNRQSYIERAAKRYTEKKNEILAVKRLLYKELREKLVAILGKHQCQKCGYVKNKYGITFQHCNGNGRKEREELGYLKFLQYYVSHPEEARKELTVWCANCNLRDAKQRKKDGRVGGPTSLHHIRYRQKRQATLFNVLLNQCQHCWESDREVLVIDHKNGDGAADLKRFGNQDTMMTYYYNHFDEARERLQLLCANCNQIKMFRELYGLADVEQEDTSDTVKASVILPFFLVASDGSHTYPENRCSRACDRHGNLHRTSNHVPAQRH